jgi:transposase-like protein
MDDMNMNLVEMMGDFAKESKCRAYLEALRWPDGVTCPRCKSPKTYRIVKRGQFVCASCEYQFSVTADTIFHDTHLPLVTWFLATLLLCESKKGMSACQIQRSLGIKTYKTAWYLCHRIRAAMAEAEKPMLDGSIEMDETYVGGKSHGRRGRGTRKRPVIGIRQRNGELRLFHSKDVTGRSLEKFLRENVGEDVDVFFTDELPAYRGIAKRMGFSKRHQVVQHGTKEYVRGSAHINTVESAFSLFKRGLRGSWHKLSAKHLQAYLDEMCFRFNNRKNPYLFRDTIQKLIESPNMEYKQLTATVREAA